MSMITKIIIVFLLCTIIVWAADTGNQNLTAVQGGTNWTNWDVDSVDTSDDDRASYAGTTQDVAGGTGFGFSIPDGATIDSIVVYTEGYGTGAGPVDQQIEAQILIAGMGTGDWVTVQLIKNVGGEAVITSIGSTDALWNTGADEADIENSTFGVQHRDINTTSDIFYIDHIQMRIVYTEVSGAKGTVIRIRGN